MQLKPYNTFGIAASCDFFVPIKDIADLQNILSNPIDKQPLPFRILGGGSNVLFTKQHLGGTLLHNCLRGIHVVRSDDTFVWVRAASGEVWHDLVQYTLQQNWGGIENLSLIPGTVGAAPVQNIGAYGVELCDVFDHLEAVHLPTGKLVTLRAEECQFGYRDSIFKRDAKGVYFITAIIIRLRRQPIFTLQYGDIQRTLDKMNVTNITVKAISDAVSHIRRSKLPDPDKLGNAGSFFKNPEVSLHLHTALKANYPSLPAYSLPNGMVKIPAAWLIEQCGWRGQRIGDAGVHQDHALVLVNYGTAQGHELWQLAQQIKSDVWQKFGIELVPEVNVWE